MSEICFVIQLIQFIDQQKAAKKVAAGWNWFFFIRQCEISCIHNLQIRLEQLSEKKAKKHQLVAVALSINDNNTKCPQT